jgi:hypothetical protein
MGLLDYLFDPNTYGDSPGGLLSRLTASQGNFQSAGFPAQGDPRLPLLIGSTRFLPRRSLPPSRIVSMPCRMLMLRPWQLR